MLEFSPHGPSLGPRRSAEDTSQVLIRAFRGPKKAGNTNIAVVLHRGHTAYIICERVEKGETTDKSRRLAKPN